MIAAIVPDADAGRQSLLARYSLWTVLLDDRLDEPGADPAALVALTDRLASVARFARNTDRANAPLADADGASAHAALAGAANASASAALAGADAAGADRASAAFADADAAGAHAALAGAANASASAALAGADAAGADPDGTGLVGDGALVGLLTELLGAFRRFGDTTCLVEALCDAMRAAVEQATRDPGALPALDDYLAVASRDINYRSFAHALVLLVAGTRPAAVRRAVDAALVPASRAVRLANDLRTVDRDLAAERLNVLSLRHPGGGPVRVAAVVRQIADDVRRHDALLGAVADPVVAAALRNSLHVAIGLYRSGDLR